VTDLKLTLHGTLYIRLLLFIIIIILIIIILLLLLLLSEVADYISQLLQQFVSECNGERIKELLKSVDSCQSYGTDKIGTVPF